ncbi:hypothetical protein [Lysobacter enzymogenes]|uniref:hypothetical protein n=1 Tax=Lysobacter enzymogenes TaxID=69 RepID=UPI001A972C5B|nr:hypothetical protein [Lysobacter enzymogenes]QQP97029.1 hypothetical protein JHW38_02940 [Lysobacter enzymogenes]
MKKRSLAAVAAFVFGCAVVTTAMAADACQTCWVRYNKCVGALDVQTCDYQVEVCLAQNGCPRPPW